MHPEVSNDQHDILSKNDIRKIGYGWTANEWSTDNIFMHEFKTLKRVDVIIQARIIHVGYFLKKSCQ